MHLVDVIVTICIIYKSRVSRLAQQPYRHCRMGCITLCGCAGAATGDIIEQYVSTIKTLREVDPTGGISCHFAAKCVLNKDYQLITALNEFF